MLILTPPFRGLRDIHAFNGDGDDDGIVVGGENNSVTGNEVFGNRRGIYVTANNSVVGGNSTWKNDLYGIIVLGESNTVSNNTVNGNGDDGIVLYFSENGVVIGNSVWNNGANGIDVYNSSYNIISNNNVQANSGHGIYLYGSNGSNHNAITNNMIVGNSQQSNNVDNGIQIDTGDYNTISGNVVRRGDGANQQNTGIAILSGTANLVINNDLYQAGATYDNYDAGTNTIFRNNRLTTGWATGYG